MTGETEVSKDRIIRFSFLTLIELPAWPWAHIGTEIIRELIASIPDLGLLLIPALPPTSLANCGALLGNFPLLVTDLASK